MSKNHSELALLGGAPHRNPEKAWPVHDELERDALLAVLESGQWFYGGQVRQFEVEFAAALLRAQLSRLEEQTVLREQRAAALNSRLVAIDGLTPQPASNRITRRAYHLYCLRIDPERFGCSRERFVEAANAEGLPIGTGYPIPLYQQPLFDTVDDYDYSGVHCPVVEDLCECSGMWITHEVLLGSEEDMDDIVAICEKVKRNAGKLS